MALFLTQLMNGIGNGAVYASLALALVLIFRTTGILNFAQGEMALYSTYLVWFFTTRGMPVWLAILIAMAISFVGGALIERVVIRPVEQASPLVARDRDDRHVPRDQLDRAGAVRERRRRRCPARTRARRGCRATCRSRRDTLVLVGVLVVECLLLYLLLQRTKLGLAFRGGRVEPRVEPAARRSRRARC